MVTIELTHYDETKFARWRGSTRPLILPLLGQSWSGLRELRPKCTIELLSFFPFRSSVRMNTADPDTLAVQEVQRLFLRHGSLLRGFILGLLPDHNRAEDVYQELFLTITRIAGEFRTGTNFLAWARAIARLKVLETIRANKGNLALLDPETLDAVAQTADELDDHWSEQREALAHCLEQLAPKAREILELRYSEELLAPPQIASRISWSLNAVNVALSRARKFLQECTRRRLALKEQSS
jgi:RNA polymerase sigma-70 factor (ECF subfamily)